MSFSNHNKCWILCLKAAVYDKKEAEYFSYHYSFKLEENVRIPVKTLTLNKNIDTEYEKYHLMNFRVSSLVFVEFVLLQL